MRSMGYWVVSGMSVVLAAMAGCAAPTVDFSEIQAPPKAAELDAYNVFVGNWDWTAEMPNAVDQDKQWKGTAKWEWDSELDNRYLHGSVHAESARARYDAKGYWGWSPSKKTYVWGMLNNWGYMQMGKADYDADDKAWTMSYDGTGLDGTHSYGKYTMKVIDDNTLEWTMCESMDAMGNMKKMSMKGTYTRRK